MNMISSDIEADEIQIEADETQESPDLSTDSDEREVLTKAGDPEVLRASRQIQTRKTSSPA
jgi:hypothetical protein